MPRYTPYQHRMSTEPPKGDPGTWGTKRDPIVVSILGWNQMHPFIQERIQHAHLASGYCVRNRFDVPCGEGQPYQWAIDCDLEGCERTATYYDEMAQRWVCGVHKC